MKTLPNTETWRHRNTHLVKGNEDLSWAEYPFLWTTKKGSGVLDKHIQPTHSCPVPGHWSMEGTKSKLMETVFFLPKLLRTSPPVPLVLAWAVSGACCVLWSQCAGPCSLRSPCCLFDQKLSPPRPIEQISARRWEKACARPVAGCVALAGSSRAGPGHFFRIKHMWERQHCATGPSTRSRSSRASGESLPRQEEETWKLESIRADLSALLSVSCTIPAPLPVGGNDDEHDSRLLQSPVC